MSKDFKLILYTAKNCPKCPTAKKIVKEVADELDLKENVDYAVKNIDEDDNLVEALTYQVASTPSVVVHGKAIYRGDIPKKEDLIKKLK